MLDRFCVYVHKDLEGVIRYVGSGTMQRANLTTPKSYRGVNYLEFAKLNKLSPEIIYSNLTKQISITLEIELYDNLVKEGNLLNIKRPNNGYLPVPTDLDAILYYDVESPSFLSWKVEGGGGNNKHLPGDHAGSKDAGGYFVINRKNTLYKVHRLVFALHYPCIDISGLVIDHIDGDRSNNNIENLRAISQTLNARNNKKRLRDVDLPTGVLWCEKRNCFQSYVKTPLEQHSNGANKDIQKTFCVSTFGSKDEALKAAIKWRESKLQEINLLLGLGYSDNHGKERNNHEQAN